MMFNNWIQPSSEIEYEKEYRKDHRGGACFLKEEVIESLNQATEIVTLSPTEINWIIGNWKFLGKFIHEDVDSLKNKKQFKNLYDSFLNNKPVPRIYIKRNKNSRIVGFDFQGGGHRMLMAMKLNIPVEALVLKG